MPVEVSELRAAVMAWREQAKVWFGTQGRAVAIVIPSYRDSHLLEQLFAGLMANTPAGKYRVIVTDDASQDDGHAAYLDRIEHELPFVSVLRNEVNGGFAKNVNRALRVLPDDIDVVLMNSDVVPLDGWLEALQHSLHLEHADIVAPKMLYADGSIQFCGGLKWFDHTYRRREEYFPPATVRAPPLYATGAVLYLTASIRSRLGLFDEGYPWAYEDVDYSLRCWLSGGIVAVEPRSVVIHHESATAQHAKPPQAASEHYFWEKHRGFFKRTVKASDGCVMVVIVSDDIGADFDRAAIFERVLELSARGFVCELWNLGPAPHSLDARLVTRGFADADALASALSVVDAIKICASWQISHDVWRGAVCRGLPALWVRTVPEGDALLAATFAASLRPEFALIVEAAQAAESLIKRGAVSHPFVAADADAFAQTLLSVGASPVYGQLPVIGW